MIGYGRIGRFCAGFGGFASIGGRVAVAGILALGLVMAGPARADGNGAKILAGIAGLALLAKILEAEREASRAEAAPAPVTRAVPQRLVRERADLRPRRAGQGFRQCLRKRWTRDGWVTFMEPGCVEQVNARRAARHGQQRWRAGRY